MGQIDPETIGKLLRGLCWGLRLLVGHLALGQTRRVQNPQPPTFRRSRPHLILFNTLPSLLDEWLIIFTFAVYFVPLIFLSQFLVLSCLLLFYLISLTVENFVGQDQHQQTPPRFVPRLSFGKPMLLEKHTP